MMNSSSNGSARESTPFLSLEQFAALFPFYLQLDCDLRITGSGPSLRKACPDAVPGKLLPELFSLERPRIPFTIESVEAASGSLFLLKHLGSSFWLRAQLWVNTPNRSLVLLGSPWIREPGALGEWNLSLADFAIHDSTPELVQSSVSYQLALDDLRRLAAKLDAQRTDLRQALDALREGDNERRLLAGIVSRSSDAVAVTDRSGRTEWVNESFVRLTGHSIEEIRGADPVLVLRGPRTDAGILDALSAARGAGRGFQGLLGSYRKDGRFFWNEVDVQPVLAADGAVSNWVYILSDVTAARVAAARNDLTLRLTRILAESINSRQAVLDLLRTICEAVGACYGGLWWIDAGRDTLRLSQFCAAPAIERSAFITTSQSSAFRPGEGLPGRVWLQNAAVSIPEIETSSEWTRKAQAIGAGLKTGIAFPIRISGATNGVIEVFSFDTEDLAPFLLPLVESFGVQIGQFIERRNAESERDRLLSLLQSALDSTQDGVVITDLNGAAIQCSDSWRRIIGSNAPVDGSHWGEGFVRKFRHAESQFADWARLQALPEQAQSAQFELVDGRTFETSTSPHWHSGSIVGQVWVFHDVTATLAELRERERLVATLNSTLESTTDGILVTSLSRERVAFNQRFLDMWCIPRDAAERNRTISLVPLVLSRLKNPDAFSRRVESLYIDQAAIGTDFFELTNGRVFELYSQPQRIADRIIGRVWCYRDVTFEWTAHRALTESEERYRLVAETAPDAIATFDTAGRIQFANQNAIDRFGVPGQTLGGASVSAFFPEAKRRSYSRLLRRLLAIGFSSSRRTFEITLLDASGRVFPAEVNIGQARRGGVLQFTAIVRDISQRKEAEEHIRQAARAAALANRAKSDFLANISHEIRTPLNAIVGLTELLRGSPLSTDVREAVDSIWVSSESLLALINDLIDISKIEAGQVDIEMEYFDAAEVAERAIEVVRIRAAAKSLLLYFYVEPAVPPPPLRGDANRIRQVLVNLLSNAVKFTESGSVTLVLRWQPDPSGVRLSYVVTDTGIGIAPADQQRIFENFYRAESPLTYQSGGAGLGLGISRAIARRLGGAISVESEPGKGSRFCFSLPAWTHEGGESAPLTETLPVLVATLPNRADPVMSVVRSAGFAPSSCTADSSWPQDTSRFPWLLVDEEWADLYDFSPPPHPGLLWLRMTGRAAEPRTSPILPSPLTPARLLKAVRSAGVPAALPPPPSPNISAPSANGARLLLIEDNPAGQLYMRKLLIGRGYQVSIAASAAEANAALRSSAFDVVLLDLQLPDGSGLDVLREFRLFESASARPATPVIVLSAHALAEFQASAISAGADGYIAKPVRPGMLLQTLDRWVARRPRVVFLAQSEDLLSLGRDLQPDAAGAALTPDGQIALPPGCGPFDVAVVIARSPSAPFLAAAIAALERFPQAARLFLGEAWPQEYAALVQPIPASPAEFGRLLRLTVSPEAPPSEPTQDANFVGEIAALAQTYLTGVRETLPGVRRNLERGALPEVAGFAHRLKGTGTAYGFPRLTALAAQLEAAASAQDRAAAEGRLAGLEHELSLLGSHGPSAQ